MSQLGPPCLLASPSGAVWSFAPSFRKPYSAGVVVPVASIATPPPALKVASSGTRVTVEEGWSRCKRACVSRSRFTCLGDNNKRDAARKALEAALGEKKDAFSKWDEEIKKREAGGGGGGGGGGRGRGWGSGGGGGGNEPGSSESSWEEAKQIFYAFTGLAALYLVLTKGKSILAFAVNSILYVLRGFKRSSSYSVPQSNPRHSSPVAPDGPGRAESNVISKWGKD
ncbi:unnamed protein product [Sphagnum jensenii]|uniref:Uncharacterized protein n=1 Tax=Sphagnum jensenii TaxID=128206 RepID=A0ABP1BXW8_9BRYO